MNVVMIVVGLVFGLGFSLIVIAIVARIIQASLTRHFVDDRRRSRITAVCLAYIALSALTAYRYPETWIAFLYFLPASIVIGALWKDDREPEKRLKQQNGEDYARIFGDEPDVRG